MGILLFPDVEVLDFAGPYEVFSRTRREPGAASRRTTASAPFQVRTIAQTLAPVIATGGLNVIPDDDFATAPPLDIVVIPGGFGSRALLTDQTTLQWIHRVSTQARQVTSVCTGALLLAKLGLLAGKRATTHWAALDTLASLDPSITVERDRRVVTDGIITSAGVSAGIDMAFQVVTQVCGATIAQETAHYIEYPYSIPGLK